MVLRNADFIERARAKGVQIPPAAARHEIPDAVLWCDALVEVIVAAEDDVDVIANENRLEGGPDLVAALVGMLPGRVERVINF